jgi:cell wall assembly regulator SMI1
MIKICEKGESITSDDLRVAEARLKIVIPEPYRSFLLENNGGRPQPSGVDIVGFSGEEADIAWFTAIRDEEESNTIASNLDILREGYPNKHVLPIATDSGGSIFCIDLEEGKGFPVVYFEWGGAWQDDPYEPLFVAPDFNAFLDMIHE